MSEIGGGNRTRPDGFDPTLHETDLDDLGLRDYSGETQFAPSQFPPSPGSEGPGLLTREDSAEGSILVSDPEYEEYYAEPAAEGEPPQDQITFDPGALEEMARWAVDEELARRTGVDEELAESEQRWQEEDAEIAAEEQAFLRAEADLDNAVATLQRVGKELGVEDDDGLREAWDVAERLYIDPSFMPGHDDHERGPAALRAGVDAMVKPRDELDAAAKYMTRKHAFSPGAVDPKLERQLETGSIMLGLSRAEKRGIREKLGWPLEES